MASGIPYVPLDCQLDEKFEYIEAEFGLQGFAIVVKLFQRIYGGHGYYCEWNDRVALLFAKRVCGVGGNVVREVVSAAIKERIFDEGMYKQYGILTSHGIQKRFSEVAKRRKQIFDRPEYVLVCCADFSDDVDISSENVCNSGENVCNSNTSKVSKASKEKSSKVNASKGDITAAPAAFNNREELVEKYGSSAVSDYEQRFRKWQSKQDNVHVEMYPTIRKWMEQDGVKSKEQDNSSIDVNSVMNDVMAKYS